MFNALEGITKEYYVIYTQIKLFVIKLLLPAIVANQMYLSGFFPLASLVTLSSVLCYTLAVFSLRQAMYLVCLACTFSASLAKLLNMTFFLMLADRCGF